MWISSYHILREFLSRKILDILVISIDDLRQLSSIHHLLEYPPEKRDSIPLNSFIYHSHSNSLVEMARILSGSSSDDSSDCWSPEGLSQIKDYYYIDCDDYISVVYHIIGSFIFVAYKENKNSIDWPVSGSDDSYFLMGSHCWWRE